MVAAAAVLLVSACGVLPDVKPFAATTLTLEKSMAQGFEETAKSHQNLAALLVVDQASPVFSTVDPLRAKHDKLAEQFRQEAPHHMQLFVALTDYTDALAAIVDAANNAEATVDALATSVDGLVSAFTGNPLTAAAPAAVKLARSIGAELIKIKASRDLGKALDAAEPSVQSAKTILLGDLDTLKTAAATKEQAVLAAIDLVEGPRLKYRKRLVNRRAELIEKLANTAASVNIESASGSVELAKVEAEIAASEPWYRPLVTRREEALAQVRSAQELFGRSSVAVEAWAKAHTDLVAAVRDHRGLNTRRLVELALEIKGIVDSMKKKETGNAGG